jgi:hypothetical protein
MANPATRRPWGSGGAPAASSGAEATPVRTPQGAAACGSYGVDTGSSRRWIGLPRRAAPTRCPRGSPQRTAPPRRPRRPPWMWVPNELLPVGICGGRVDPAARRGSWFSAVVGAALWRAAARRLPPRPAAVRRRANNMQVASLGDPRRGGLLAGVQRRDLTGGGAAP